MTSPAPSRPFYRVRQFWQALHARPSEPAMARAQAILSPQQFALFSLMQPSEQVHSLRLLEQLQEHAPLPHDLRVAALLHDAGKSLFPLRLWERIWIVLARAFAPAWVQRWGSQPVDPGIPFWQRPLAVACQHPEWGARLAEQAGASPLAVAIIRRHQQPHASANGSTEDELLRRLQAVDDQN